MSVSGLGYRPEFTDVMALEVCVMVVYARSTSRLSLARAAKYGVVPISGT
jgi:hypothetical protein